MEVLARSPKPALGAVLVVSLQSQEPLRNMRLLLRLIDKEFNSARPGALAVAADLSSALFVLMLRLLGSPICAKAVNAMAGRPAQPWTLDSLAEVAHVSRATLVRAFRQGAGTAPLVFLTQLRLHLVRRNLASSSAPLSQVAVIAGFSRGKCDPSHADTGLGML